MASQTSERARRSTNIPEAVDAHATFVKAVVIVTMRHPDGTLEDIVATHLPDPEDPLDRIDLIQERQYARVSSDVEHVDEFLVCGLTTTIRQSYSPRKTS